MKSHQLLRFRKGAHNYVAAAHVTTIWYDATMKRWYFVTSDDTEGNQTSIDAECWTYWTDAFPQLPSSYEPPKGDQQ